MTINAQLELAFRAMPSVLASQLPFVVSLLAFAGCLHWIVPWQVALAAVVQPFVVAGGPARSVSGAVPLPQVPSLPVPKTIHMAHPILM